MLTGLSSNPNTVQPAVTLWWQAPQPQGDDEPAATDGGSVLPSKERLDYTKTSLETLLLIVAVLALLGKFARAPGRVVSGLGEHHLG